MRPISIRAVTAVAAIGFFAMTGAAQANCGALAPAESRAHTRASPEAIQNILNQAAQSLAQGDFTQACTKYQMVLSVDATNVAAHLGLGEGALGEGDFVAARSHFQPVADADP